jgi:hypothetical protein
MKIFPLFILLLPSWLIAQNQTNKKSTSTAKVSPAPNKALTKKNTDGFSISGIIKGFPDGTNVSLLNGQTGAPESETVLTNNAFSFKGKLVTPEFKIILFDKKPPYITLFLDNSNVQIKGEKDSLEAAMVSGSSAHADFIKLNQLLAPYQKLFSSNNLNDGQEVASALAAIENFVKRESSSFVAPLAVIRCSQLNPGLGKTEELFNQLSAEVKNTPMGNYVAQQIAKRPQNQNKNQNQPAIDPALKNSFLYNKYFKDYKEATTNEPEVRVPKTMEEYRRMLIEDKIKQIQQIKKMKQLKSTV